jgi:murein L,D-transpeptidase YafK
MKKLLLSFAVVLSVFGQNISAQEFLPSTIYQMDNKFNHHVLVVEKNTHSLYLYEYKENQKYPTLLKKFQVATGKIIGDKEVQGDKKTPEGIYFFRRFFSSKNLIDKYGKTGLIYGAGAFTLNYPNEVDLRHGKTGGGIWLHSTDDDKRISKGLDSRGCVVAMDANLKEISQYIELGKTSAVIVQDLKFISIENWEKKKSNIFSTLNTWMSAWQNKDFDAYINSYSKKEFRSGRGGYKSYKTYKRHVFARADKPEIKFSNLSVLHNGEYVVVTLQQDYNSAVIQDVGKKILYLKQNKNYEWKIISENFQKIDQIELPEPFSPSQRFFINNVSNNNLGNEVNDSESI